jgi:hypothetical protein
MIKLSTIQALHPNAAVTQHGSKQLFTVIYPTYRLLLSYLTIVGIDLYNGIGWQVTTQRYRVTTTRQVNSIPHTKIKRNLSKRC